ncbi:MAG TPA: hypothetical protein VEK79_05480 [Thermoanaerobaculia bacterium]|nr:hypothetical protein [Thermoanaerobaculia bacterium]
MKRVSKKYALPHFLIGRCTQAVYERWLRAKADAHVKRDRKRGNAMAVGEAYLAAIHAAVTASNGNDDYTGEPLEWERISTYSNEESKVRRREYKRELALLPTVDHVGDGLGAPDFRICAWRTNDCKNDLTADELLAFCRRVIEYAQTGSAVRA